MGGEGILTQDQIETLITSFATSRGGTFTLDEAAQIIRWAEETEINSGILGNVLSGTVRVDISSEGELIFAITDEGVAEAKRIEAAAVIDSPDDDHGLLSMPDNGIVQ